MEYQHLVIGLLALLSCIKAESYLGSGYETVYDYFGDVRAGSNFPAEFASQFGIKAKLRVQYVDSNKAIFKFNDVSYQVSTGPLADEEQPKAKFITAPKESAYLYEPFQVIYDHGKVKNVLTVDEPEWSENMKRAVAAIFQLDTQHLNFEKPNSFVTDEPTLYGECTVGYTVQPKGEGYVDVIKTQEYSKCKNMPFRYYTNGVYDSCPFDYTEDLLQGSVRFYKLKTGQNKIEVKEIFSQSATAAVPFNGKSDDQTIFVRQNFTLLSLDTIKERIEFVPKHERDLKYSIPHYYNEIGTYSDLTGGREFKNQEELMKKAHEKLGELVDFMEDFKVSKEPEKINNQLSQRLLYYYGQFNLECFNKCFEMYMKPTVYREENLRGAFLELVAQVGSKASVLFIRDIIVNHKIPDALAVEVLRLVPFYVRDPDASFLQKYEAFFNTQLDEKVKKAAVLSVSNMAFMTYKKVHDIHIINEYAEKFYDYFKEASEYGLKLNYLTALANLEEGKAFDYLVEIVNDKAYHHHLRYIALWGTKHVAMKDHVKGYDLYWPIFSNDHVEMDIRVAAMKLIMVTEPTFDRFLSVFWYMQAETNSQLYYYYYTGLESMSRTNHPCYKTMGHHAERLFRYAKKPMTTYLFTGDYLMDYIDPKHSLGGSSILSLIGDEYSGAPDTIYYSQNGYYSGYDHSYFGVLIKMSGLTKFFLEKMPKINWETIKVADLPKMLAQLNIKPRHLDNFRLEIIFYTSERVVETRYYDADSFLADKNEIGKNIQNDFKIRQHNLIFAGIHEYIQPTDIGFPAVWNLAMPYSFSVVANLTHDTTGPRITRKNAVEIRYGRYGGHSLSFYNPFGGMWQGAYRMHSHMYTLPIYNHLSIDAAQKHVKFAITRDLHEDFHLATVYHVKSQVFVTDSSKSDALHESCPSCTPYVTVHAPGKVSQEKNFFHYDSQETGLEYSLGLFDCDQPHTPYDIAHHLYDVFDSHDLNYGHNFFSRFYITFRKLHTLLNFQPYVGSCGLIFNAKPSEKYPYTQLEGVMHLTHEDATEKNLVYLTKGGKSQFRGSVTLKGDDAEHVYHTFDINAIYDYTHDYIDNHVSVKLTHTAPKEKEFKFCMDAEVKYPELPSDMYVLRKHSEEDVAGKFTVMWGDSVDGKCPTDGKGFKVTMTASVPHYDEVEHETEYPYSVCKHDHEEPEWKGKSYTPITSACIKAAMDATTLHKFAGYVKYFNIPEEYFSFGSKFVNFMEHTGEYLIHHEKKEKTVDGTHVESADPHSVKDKHREMKYVVEFEENRPYVDVNMSWEGEKYEHYYQMKYDSFGFEPFLTSSRFFLLKRFGYSSGLWGSCAVTPSSVLTYDNDTYHFKSSHCYTLVSADCSEQPRFAVFTKKVEGPFDLAMKFYSGGHYVEIIPDEAGHFNLFVDGHAVEGGVKNGYKYPEDEDYIIFEIKEKDGFINVDAKKSFVEVDYTGHSVVTSVPGLFRGVSCGLCGDFNGDDLHFERVGDVSHDCHKSYMDAVDGEFLGYRYTYRDEKCPEVTEDMTRHIECVGHHH